LIGAAAHDDGFAAQFGPLEQFHRDKKGIHVHVQNGGSRKSGLLLERAVLGSESRQVWHVQSFQSAFRPCNCSRSLAIPEFPSKLSVKTFRNFGKDLDVYLNPLSAHCDPYFCPLFAMPFGP